MSSNISNSSDIIYLVSNTIVFSEMIPYFFIMSGLFAIFFVDICNNLCKNSSNICPRIFLEFIVVSQILLAICYFISYPLYISGEIKIFIFSNILSYLQRNILTVGTIMIIYVLVGILNMRYIRAIRDSNLIKNKCVTKCMMIYSIVIIVLYIVLYIIYAIVAAAGMITHLFVTNDTTEIIIAISVGFLGFCSVILTTLTITMTMTCLISLIVYMFKMTLFIPDPEILKKNRTSMMIFISIMSISLILSIICALYIIFAVINLLWKYFNFVSYSFYLIFVSLFIISLYILFKPSESLKDNMGRRKSK